MPGTLSEKLKTTSAATRKVARVVFSTIKKIGNSRGVTLKKIYDYIKEEYPNSPANIVRLNNTLEKALAFGAINKKIGNRYVLGAVIKSLEKPTKRGFGIIQARRRRRRRGRRGRKRGRKGRRGRRRRRGRHGRGKHGRHHSRHRGHSRRRSMSARRYSYKSRY